MQQYILTSLKYIFRHYHSLTFLDCFCEIHLIFELFTLCLIAIYHLKCVEITLYTITNLQGWLGYMNRWL